MYVQAGILDDRESDTDVQAAIRADVGLSERQKQVLLDIYESFRNETGSTAAPDAEAATRTTPPTEGTNT